MKEIEYVNVANCLKLREALKLLSDIVPVDGSMINAELLQAVVRYTCELQEEASKSYSVTESG